jgi:membrane dipeptidase
MNPGPLVLDSHIDIPWPDPPDPFQTSARCVDFPKMRQGGMQAGCFVAYVPQTVSEEPLLAQSRQRALDMLANINTLGRDGGDFPVRVVSRTTDIEEAAATGALIVIPVVENGHALGGRLDSVGAFARLGVRYITLTHNGHNDLADSAVRRPDLNDPEARHGGLSAFGRDAIDAMNQCGIVVDVSHAAKSSMMQAVEASAAPVVASHSCVRALCDHPRNLDDQQLDRLAAAGGVIQITAMPYFLRKGGRPKDVGIGALLDHIDYAVRRIGIAHVGISSDFDGGGGIQGWSNAAETANVTEGLRGRGYGEADIAALWGANFLRVLRRAEQVAG